VRPALRRRIEACVSFWSVSRSFANVNCYNAIILCPRLIPLLHSNADCVTSQAKIDETTGTMRLENEMTGRQVKSTIEAKEKALVDHDVTKLEVKRVRDILAMHADEVFSLENRKLQLKLSMDERRHEIEVHR